MRYILSKIKPHKLIFIFGIIFLSIEAICDLLLPSVMSYIVDLGIAKNDLATISKAAAIMLVIALIGACCAFCRNRLSALLSERVGRDIRAELFERTERFSLSSFEHFKAGTLITRLTNDITHIQGFVYGLLRILIKAPIMCVGAMSLIIINTPQFAPVLALLIVLATIWTILNVAIGYPRFNVVQEKLDNLNSKIREFLLGIRLVKAYSAEKKERSETEALSLSLKNTNIKALRVAATFMPLVNFSVNLGILLILILSNIERKSEVGALMATINYMTQLLASLSMVSNIVNRSVRAGSSAHRIQSVLNWKDDDQDTSGTECLNSIENIEFKNVSFSYPSSKELTLKGIDLTLNKGQVLSIIGPTGSGKSTLINLLPRFYDCTEGQILINGENSCVYNLKMLRKNIAIVTQHPFLFSGTIADNLRFAKDNATDEELINALKDAEAYNFVFALPDKMETVLGQGGVNLSGGQKQRLSIARALVANSSLLILDDATSALDSFTERKVLENLFNKGCTIILVTQRISTVCKADTILTLDKGVVAGEGSHSFLLKNCEVYCEIYNSQMGGDE